MRRRTWTIWCCLVAAGCGGSGGATSPVEEGLEARLDDACFTDGRVVGLEHRADDCALTLGLATTGVWEQTLESCEAGSTAWQDLRVEADVPEGATMEVAYRLSQDVLVPVGLPWTAIDGDAFDLGSREGRFLEVRVELHASPDGRSPELRGVSVGRACGDPG